MSYISSLDENKLRLYTLQLANMQRIEEHSVVYIFDEVGAGKTISAGLSIIQLLFESNSCNAYNNVLIITAPSVVMQFTRKLEETLGLKCNEETDYLGKKYFIQVINYDYRNIEKQKKQWDFIIIDEAHEFLNEETIRYKKLINLKCKKMMFLTATPLRYSKKDLDIYPQIASNILYANNKDSLLKELTNELYSSCENKEMLSGCFNLKSPVTRYFKETVRNIEKTKAHEDFANKEPIRLIPELWQYSGDKNDYLINKICNINTINSESKFVIFVNRIKETELLKNKFINNGFIEYYNDINEKESFCIITGETTDRKFKLETFSSEKKDVVVPKVLIMTYKIAEQGIDLPQYNYVVNYHIPASPSSLEQRFGRIDRLNSIHKELNMCFMLNKDNNLDTSTSNFYIAINTFMNEFLPLFPSKNCLINKEVLEYIETNRQKVFNYCDYLKRTCDNNYIFKLFFDSINSGKIVENDDIFQLIYFFRDRNLEFNSDINIFKRNFIIEIEKIRKQTEKNQKNIDWWKRNLSNLSNDLFYVETDEEKIDWNKNYEIKHIDAKASAKKISETDEYKKFSETFRKPIDIMRAWNERKPYFEKYFEDNFEEYFMRNIYLLDCIKNNQLSNIEENIFEFKEKCFGNKYDLLINDIKSLIYSLPFFKMCREYKHIIYSLAFNDKGGLYTKYEFNPLRQSFETLYCFRNSLASGVTSEFWKKYNEVENVFYFNINDNTITASSWLKLLYMYSNRNTFTIGSFKDIDRNNYSYKKIYEKSSEGYINAVNYDLTPIYKNIKRLNNEIKVLEKNYDEEMYQYDNVIKVIEDGEDVSFNGVNELEKIGIFEPDCSELLEKKRELDEYESDLNNVDWSRSLFYHFRYTLYSGKIRKNSESSIKFIENNKSTNEYYNGDIKKLNANWITREIINDIF